MTKTSPKKESSAPQIGPSPIQPDTAPLKPRPILFAIMSALLVVLLAGLLTLYFKTVYPLRDKPHVIETDKSDAPGAAR